MSISYNAETKIITVDEFEGEELKLEDLYNRKSQLEAGLLVQSNIDRQAETDAQNESALEKYSQSVSEANGDKEKLAGLVEPTPLKGRLEVIQEALDRTNSYIAEAESLGATLK